MLNQIYMDARMLYTFISSDQLQSQLEIVKAYITDIRMEIVNVLSLM